MGDERPLTMQYVTELEAALKAAIGLIDDSLGCPLDSVTDYGIALCKEREKARKECDSYDCWRERLFKQGKEALMTRVRRENDPGNDNPCEKCWLACDEYDPNCRHAQFLKEATK